MSGAIATAYVKLIPTFDKQLKSSIEKQLGGVDGKKTGSKVGKLFARGVDSGMSGLKTSMTSRFSAATVAVGNIAAKAFTSAMSAVASSMDSAIARVDTLNNFPRIMEGMGIGAEESAAAIKRLSAGIDGLPTALDDAASGVQRFTSKNGDIAKSTDYFLAVNNAIASGGQSMQVQSSALEQLSQSYSKGKMDMMEWRSLQQAMPAQLNQIAKAMGMTADELGEGLRSGSVSMDEFMDKIVELNETGIDGLDSFADQARKATGGIGTALTNVQNRINKAVAGILDAIGQENISKAINDFSSQLGKIGSIIGGTNADGDIVGFVAGLKDGLAKAFDGWEPKFSIDWGELFGNATKAAQSFGEFLSGPIATAIETVDTRMAHLREVAEVAFSRLDLPDIDWGAVSDGISSVVEALVNIQFDYWDTFLNTVTLIAMWMQDTLGPAVEKLQPGLERAGQAASEFFSPIADFIAGVGPAYDDMMERIRGHIEDMGPIAEDLAMHFNSICEKLEPLAGPLGSAAADALGNLLSAIVGLGTIALGILDSLLELIDEIITAVQGAAEAVSGFVDGFLGGLNLLPPEMQEVIDQAGVVGSSIDEIPSEKITTIKVDDQASGILGGILGKMSSIAQGVIARVMAQEAAGGFYKLHAAGGFITNGPTVLGRDAYGTVHIAGEAGREWIKRHADGTTSIIPIENRRYLKPYAEEIAGMIGGTGQSTTYNLYIDGMRVNDDAQIQAAVMDLFGTMRRKAVMLNG